MRIYNLAQRSNIDFYFSHMDSDMALEVEQDPDQPFDELGGVLEVNIGWKGNSRTSVTSGTYFT